MFLKKCYKDILNERPEPAGTSVENCMERFQGHLSIALDEIGHLVNIFLNYCHAEPGYTLPLQTV